MSSFIPGMPARPDMGTRPTEPLKRKTGLIRIVPGSKHQVVVKPSSGAPTMSIYTTARDAESILSQDALNDAAHPPVVVCLHPVCAGKAWSTERAMQLDHGSAADMAKMQQAHPWGLWSQRPADPAALAEAQKGLAEAKKKLDAAKGEAARAEAAAEVQTAETAVRNASAVVGLIAPPVPHGDG